MPLQDRPIPVHPVAGIGAEPHLLGAAQASAIQTDIHRPTANVQRARVTTVVARQSQRAPAFILVDLTAARQVTSQNAQIRAAPSLNVDALIDVDRVRDGHIVGIERRAEAEDLAIEAVVVAVPINPVAGVGGGQRNRQRSTEAREPTRAIEADLTETSAVHSIADFSGKGAAGAEDTILEANHRSVWQTHPLLGDQHGGIVHLGFTGVEVGSRQIDVAVGRVVIKPTLMGFQAFAGVFFGNVKGVDRPGAEPDVITNPHAGHIELTTFPDLQEVDVQGARTRRPQLGVVMGDVEVLEVCGEIERSKVNQRALVDFVGFDGVQIIADSQRRAIVLHPETTSRQSATREVGGRSTIGLVRSVDVRGRASGRDKVRVIVHPDTIERKAVVEGQRGVVQLDPIAHRQRRSHGAEGLVHEPELVTDRDVAIRRQRAHPIERATSLDSQVTDVQSRVSGDRAVLKVDRGVARRGQQGAPREVKVGRAIVHRQRAVHIQALPRPRSVQGKNTPIEVQVIDADRVVRMQCPRIEVDRRAAVHRERGRAENVHVHIRAANRQRGVILEAQAVVQSQSVAVRGVHGQGLAIAHGQRLSRRSKGDGHGRIHAARGVLAHGQGAVLRDIHADVVSLIAPIAGEEELSTGELHIARATEARGAQGRQPASLHVEGGVSKATIGAVQGEVTRATLDEGTRKVIAEDRPRIDRPSADESHLRSRRIHRSHREAGQRVAADRHHAIRKGQSPKGRGNIRHRIQSRVRQHLDFFRRQVERPDR